MKIKLLSSAQDDLFASRSFYEKQGKGLGKLGGKLGTSIGILIDNRTRLSFRVFMLRKARIDAPGPYII